MNAVSLLADLTSRGVVLTEVDGDIRIEVSKGEITNADIQAIRQHKAEMIELLIARREMHQKAIAHAISHPSTREEIGLLWMTEPGGFVPCESHEPTIPGTCDRCGSDQYQDYAIHNGRSIRRDCAKCRRFIRWPKWDPSQED